MNKPLWQASAVEIVAGIREKRFSCSEVMASVVERIRAVNPKLNAIITDLTDQAIAPCTDVSCARSPRSTAAEGLNAGIRPGVGLSVTTPLANAGNRKDPPMSLP